MATQTTAGNSVIQVLCDKDRFDVVKDKQLHCYFNRNALISTTRMDDTTFIPLVGLLVKSSYRKPSVRVRVKWGKGFADALKSMLDALSKSDQAKVEVLEDKPDEMSENKPKEASFSYEDCNQFNEKIKTFPECYDNLLSFSGLLLRTDLPKTARDSKEIKNCIHRMKLSYPEFERNRENFEIAAEQVNFKIGSVGSVFGDRRAKENPNVRASVDAVVGGFLTIKKLMSSCLQSFHNLYAGDQLFKRHTGYPATWFFNPSVFYNFTDSYETMAENLVDSSRAESSVIKPLYLWKNAWENREQ